MARWDGVGWWGMVVCVPFGSQATPTGICPGDGGRWLWWWFCGTPRAHTGCCAAPPRSTPLSCSFRPLHQPCTAHLHPLAFPCSALEALAGLSTASCNASRINHHRHESPLTYHPATPAPLQSPPWQFFRLSFPLFHYRLPHPHLLTPHLSTLPSMRRRPRHEPAQSSRIGPWPRR